MKKLIFFLIFLIISNINAQNPALDIENGYKHLKFGMSPSEIKDIQETEGLFPEKSSKKKYLYTGKDLDSFFNIKIQRIVLFFFNDKLYLIELSFWNEPTRENLTLKQYLKLKKSLVKKYGEHHGDVEKQGEIIDGVYWSGDNVDLELYRQTFFKNNPTKFGGGGVNFFEKTLLGEMYESKK